MEGEVSKMIMKMDIRLLYSSLISQLAFEKGVTEGVIST